MVGMGFYSNFSLLWRSVFWSQTIHCFCSLQYLDFWVVSTDGQVCYLSLKLLTLQGLTSQAGWLGGICIARYQEETKHREGFELVVGRCQCMESPDIESVGREYCTGVIPSIHLCCIFFLCCIFNGGKKSFQNHFWSSKFAETQKAK